MYNFQNMNMSFAYVYYLYFILLVIITVLYKTLAWNKLKLWNINCSFTPDSLRGTDLDDVHKVVLNCIHIFCRFSDKIFALSEIYIQTYKNSK